MGIFATIVTGLGDMGMSLSIASTISTADIAPQAWLSFNTQAQRRVLHFNPFCSVCGMYGLLIVVPWLT